MPNRDRLSKVVLALREYQLIVRKEEDSGRAAVYQVNASCQNIGIHVVVTPRTVGYIADYDRQCRSEDLCTRIGSTFSSILQ